MDADWEPEGTNDLEEAERVGVKRHLRDLQDSCRDKGRKVPKAVAEAFGLANELF